jgi:anaerobic ribonucleoside-triphosphate reductase
MLGFHKRSGVKKAIKCEVYSRIVGYYRPVDSWNKGKQEEFKDREVFTKEDIENAQQVH